MKVFLIPFLILLFPGILLYLLFFEGKFEIFKNKWAVLFFGMLFLFLNLFLIDISVGISAEGTFEKGIKCAEGSIIFIPIGFICSIFIIPLITLKKILKNKNEL